MWMQLELLNKGQANIGILVKDTNQMHSQLRDGNPIRKSLCYNKSFDRETPDHPSRI